MWGSESRLAQRCFKVEQIESETDMIEVQERAADVPEDSECAISEGDHAAFSRIFVKCVVGAV